MRNYLANYTNPMLLFGFVTSGSNFHYVDSVSVVDSSNPSVELLDNGGFDNTSIGIPGWNEWCASTCGNNGNTSSGEQVISYRCGLAPNQCLQAFCNGTGGIYFIGQSFSAIIGNIYNISFWYIAGSGGGNQFYVDIV